MPGRGAAPLLLVAFLANACASPGTEELTARELSAEDAPRTPTGVEAPMVQGATLVPDVFASTFPEEIAVEARFVPEKMLALADVTRPRAEVRTGPGAQFELSDMLLRKGETVLVFSSVGVWRKVLVPKLWQRGWVHSGALGPARLNAKPMAVEMSQLPTVLALRPVSLVGRFPDLAPLKVDIPKGAMFRSLMAGPAGTLVWLPETNSVMWLSAKDAQ